MEQPIYVVFAGINGVGKSTYYHSGDWKAALPYVPKKMKRINSDEILRHKHGDPNNPKDQLAAGKIALHEIDALFEKRASLNQETTLSGHLAVQHIKNANELGYRIFLFYLGLESPELAIERIAHRVEAGGHYIEPRLVRKRYERSLSNLARVLDYCEEVLVLDNTNYFQSLMQWSAGTLCWSRNPATSPSWLLDAIQNEELWCRHPTPRHFS